MMFKTQPKEGAICLGRGLRSPPPPAPKLAEPVPSMRGTRRAPYRQAGVSQGMRGGEGVAFASLGGNHRKQILPSSAWNPKSVAWGWRAGHSHPGGLGVTWSPRWNDSQVLEGQARFLGNPAIGGHIHTGVICPGKDPSSPPTGLPLSLHLGGGDGASL